MEDRERQRYYYAWIDARTGRRTGAPPPRRGKRRIRVRINTRFNQEQARKRRKRKESASKGAAKRAANRQSKSASSELRGLGYTLWENEYEHGAKHWGFQDNLDNVKYHDDAVKQTFDRFMRDFGLMKQVVGRRGFSVQWIVGYFDAGMPAYAASSAVLLADFDEAKAADLLAEVIEVYARQIFEITSVIIGTIK